MLATGDIAFSRLAPLFIATTGFTILDMHDRAGRHCAKEDELGFHDDLNVQSNYY